MANQIGIMQGRLSPSIDGKIQFFPWQTWEKEFGLAQQVGLNEIEFIFDVDDYLLNPVFSETGAARIRRLVEESGVRVNFICADYFMGKPFYSASHPANLGNAKILRHLIFQANMIGARGIEIPLVDNSAIKNDKEMEILIRELKSCLPFAEQFGITLGLETDLPPKRFRELLDEFSHPLVRANYDVGNSAALGYNVTEEFNTYGKYINNIHIKDRIKGNGTVPLGTGNADFASFFALIKQINYQKSLILQAARDGDEIAAAKNNILFVRKYLESEVQ